MRKINKISPVQTLTIGYMLFSIVGGILLYLPVSAAPGETTSFLDALFMSASAISTTGLIVVDTGSHFSMFGQIVIMILIQIGGLGYMLFFIIFMLLLGKKLSLQDKLLLSESVKPMRIEVIRFAKLILIYTVIVELIGTVALSIYFSRYYPLGRAVWSALFHSLSAFNTAGFSIYADSLMGFQSSLWLNVIIIVIFMLGGLGFWVIFETIDNVLKKFKNKNVFVKYSLHTKVVYLLSFVILITGTLIIFYSEKWSPSLSYKNRILFSIFQTLTATSTTGFNTIDIGSMSVASLTYITGIMFIGSGSGSTGGGIKLTTFVVIVALIISILQEKEDTNISKQKIDAGIIRQSITITFLAFLWIFFSVLILSFTENGTFFQILFEVTSALSTVGLSTGITGGLTAPGKIIIIISMLIGRIGPLGIGLSILKRQLSPIKYPLADIFIG